MIAECKQSLHYSGNIWFPFETLYVCVLSVPYLIESYTVCVSFVITISYRSNKILRVMKLPYLNTIYKLKLNKRI